MRLIILVYGIFALFLTGSIYILANTSSYEQSIIGQWEEVSWEFEKSDHPTDSLLQLDDFQKAEICKNLTLHQAEIWEFKPGKQISLYNKKKHPIQHLEWTIKGRGNILKIQHTDQDYRHPLIHNLATETYQIQEIHNDTMVMHFNFDLQVRGIVKMTFKRVTPQTNIEYAAKTP